MDIHAVPPTLRDRLGAEATGELLQLLDLVDHERREDLITGCTDRFERRLVEEVAGLRVLIGHVDSSIRQEMTQLGASLRQEMTHMGAELRQEMALMRGDLLRQMAADRFESLRWAFLFWIGQVVAIGTLFGLMLRLGRAG